MLDNTVNYVTIVTVQDIKEDMSVPLQISNYEDAKLHMSVESLHDFEDQDWEDKHPPQDPTPDRDIYGGDC
ncbi:MAG: hypothetical protein GY861_03385 [bacterium]|nr:hypothetical protein [bacterium]